MSYKYLNKIFVFFAILLLPFQNTVLGETAISFLGRSPSFIFIALMLVLAFIKFVFYDSACRVSTFKSYIIIYLLGLSLISAVCFFDVYIYGRWSISKGLNLIVLNILLLFPFFIFTKFDNKIFKKLFLISFLVCCLGVVLGDYFHLDFIEHGVFQMTPRPSSRPRGFSFEPSMLAVTIFPLFLSYYCLENKSGKINLSLVFSLFLLAVFVTSKGALGTLLLSFFITHFVNRDIFTFKGMLFSLFILCVSIPIFYYLIFMLSQDLENSTSIATRSITILTALISLLKYPFGVGTFGFLFSFQSCISSAIDFFSNALGIQAKFFEILAYVDADSDSTIGTKSMFFNFVIYFGFPFIILFIYVVIDFIKAARSVHRQDLEFGFLFVVFSLFFFTEGVGMYALSFYLAVAFYELNLTKNNFINGGCF